MGGTIGVGEIIVLFLMMICSLDMDIIDASHQSYKLVLARQQKLHKTRSTSLKLRKYFGLFIIYFLKLVGSFGKILFKEKFFNKQNDGEQYLVFFFVGPFNFSEGSIQKGMVFEIYWYWYQKHYSDTFNDTWSYSLSNQY